MTQLLRWVIVGLAGIVPTALADPTTLGGRFETFDDVSQWYVGAYLTHALRGCGQTSRIRMMFLTHQCNHTCQGQSCTGHS